MCAKQSLYGLGEEAPKTPLRWLYLPFMLLLGLCSMALATQRIAAFFDYQAALGQPWGVAFGVPWYAPWSAFLWQERFGASDTYGFIDQAMTHSQALFLLPQFMIIGFWLCFQKKLRGSANLHGSARWARESEIKRMGYFEGKGVYVGGWLKKYAGMALLLRKLKAKPEEVQFYLRHNGPGTGLRASEPGDRHGFEQKPGIGEVTSRISMGYYKKTACIVGAFYDAVPAFLSLLFITA